MSVGGATVIEGDTTNRPLGALVPANYGGLATPYAMIVGPDGLLYVSDIAGGRVLRYDPATGAAMPAPGGSGAEFVSAGSGGLQFARDLAFDPDGNLYVVSEGTDAVLRYDVTARGRHIRAGRGRGGHRQRQRRTGRPARPDLPGRVRLRDQRRRRNGRPGQGLGAALRRRDRRPGGRVRPARRRRVHRQRQRRAGQPQPHRLRAGRAGVRVQHGVRRHLPTTNSILRYDGTTGAPAGVSGQPGDAVFVSPGSGGLDGPVAMVFRPDGYLYVTSWRNSAVFRYQIASGAAADHVVPPGSGGLSSPIDLLFEADGNLLVTSRNTNEVLRFGPGLQVAFTVSLSFRAIPGDRRLRHRQRHRDGRQRLSPPCPAPSPSRPGRRRGPSSSRPSTTPPASRRDVHRQPVEPGRGDDRRRPGVGTILDNDTQVLRRQRRAPRTAPTSTAAGGARSRTTP